MNTRPDGGADRAAGFSKISSRYRSPVGAIGHTIGGHVAKTTTDTPDLDNEARITLDLLNIVEDDATVSQRWIASNLGIALGLANAYLKRCVRKGLIKIRQAPANRYAYYLTPQGFAEKSRLTAEYLSQSFNLFRRARAEGATLLAECQNRGWKRVALYGVGDLTEIFTLSARDFSIDLIAVVNGNTNASQVAGLPVVREVPSVDDVDAIIVCDIVQPQASYDRVCASFPPEQVLTPGFLGIVKRAGGGGDGTR